MMGCDKKTVNGHATVLMYKATMSKWAWGHMQTRHAKGGYRSVRLHGKLSGWGRSGRSSSVDSFSSSSRDRPMPTFDEERLRELSTVVDLRDTLLGFIKHGRALVEEVAASCTESAEDCTSRTAKAAHALKGAAKTIGASRLAHSAEIIELRAKQGESCGSYVPDLSAAYEDLATGVSQRTWS
ncbi:hypothetical protein VYU27_006659 [Nannochloropsis oceanica]